MTEVETENELEIVKLKSKQEEVFEVEAKAAFRSITIKNMIDRDIWLSTSTLEGYDDSVEEEV